MPTIQRLNRLGLIASRARARRRARARARARLIREAKALLGKILAGKQNFHRLQRRERKVRNGFKFSVLAMVSAVLRHPQRRRTSNSEPRTPNARRGFTTEDRSSGVQETQESEGQPSPKGRNLEGCGPECVSQHRLWPGRPRSVVAGWCARDPAGPKGCLPRKQGPERL